MKLVYREIFTNPFLNDVKDIKKDKIILDRLSKKIGEIIINPEHYPPKKHDLKGKRGAHIGSFVVLFEIEGENVIFHRFKHHDYVYK